MKLHTLALSTLAALTLGVFPVQADLVSNLKHTPKAPDGFVSLSTNYEDWKYFLSKKPFAAGFNQTLKSMAPELEKELGMNFEKDLVPMIGTHLSIAYYQKEFSKTETVPLLLVFDLKNTQGFPKLITRLKEVAAKDKDKGKQVQISTYKGITLYGFISARRADGVPYMALSNHTLLIGSKGLVTKAIDASQQQSSALNDANFKSMYEVLKTNKIWTYATPDLLDSSLNVDEIDPTVSQSNKTRLKDNLSLYQSMGFGLDLNPNGLMIKTLAKFKPNQASAQKSLIQSFTKIWNDPKAPLLKILQGSPAKPLMMLGFNGMHLYQQSMQLLGGTDPDTQKVMDELAAGFRQFSGLDFQQDLVKYSDGRGGVAIFYPENTKIFDRAPHLVTYLGIKDVKGFQSVVQNKFKLNLPAETTGDQKKPAIQIQFPKQSNSSYRGYPLFIAKDNPEAKKLKDSWFVQPAYSQVGDIWVFASNPDGLKAALDQLSGQKSSLVKNSYFQSLSSKHRMQLNGGVFYMDLSATMKLVEFLGGADPEVKQLKPTLNAFKSIMGGSRMVNDMAEGTFVVDVDMDKIDYELLAKIFNLMGGKDLGKPKAKPGIQAQTKPTAQPSYRPANKPARPVVKHQVGL